MATFCATCGAALRPAGFGRPPKYCQTCAKARAKEQRAQYRELNRDGLNEKNRERKRKYMREYRAAHLDEMRDYNRAWYLAHREEILSKQRGGAPPREKRERTPEAVSAYNRQYYAAHREEIAAKRKAKKGEKMNKYSYGDLRQKATAPDATQSDLKELAEWCSAYGDCWNGEYYDISAPGRPSGDMKLRPIYKRPETDEDEVEIIGYEID